MIDYRELLEKYVDWVGEMEGMTHIYSDMLNNGFTREEFLMLLEIDND